MKATPWNLDHQSWQVLSVPQQLPHPRAHPAEHHENHRGPQCGGHPKVERLLWRGTILLLRLFGDFPPVFLFGSKISAHSTKQAPLFLELVSGTCGRNRSTPALPRPPLCVPTSTPKPRAVSSNLTAPANPLVPRLCENRMAWGFFVPMLPWTGSSFSLPMPYMSPSCVISSHRLSKIQHQNRTPSFRFLRVSTTCGPLALSHAARLSKNFPFLCLLHRNF